MALSDGLVGYWSPWLGSSGYTLLDRARNSHGSLVNMDAGTDWLGASIQGRSGRVLDFDGTNDRIEATTQSVGAITSAVTVSIWMNLSATGRSASLFGINSTASATSRMQAHAPWSDNNIYWDFGGSGGVNRLTVTGQSWTVGKWEHLVFRGGGRGMFCWRNGLLIGSSTNSATRTTNSNQFVIGGSLLDGNPPYYHQGQVAETSVFAREINNAEVLELYRLGPGWYRPYAKRGYAYAAAAGFKAYWHRRQSQVIGGGLR